ncbi:phage tail spike protein [Eubacteriales bacterium KG125]
MSKVYLYEANEKEFLNRGLGVLHDISEPVISEEINGIFDLYFYYPIDGVRFGEITEERIVCAKSKKGYQAFRIDSISKDDNELGIFVHAFHISYDLAYNFVEDTFIQDKGGESAINQLLDRAVTPHNFRGLSDVKGPISSRLVRKNILSALMGDEENSLLKRGGGEIERDNFILNWKKKIGMDRGVSIKYKKNLTGLNFKLDESSVITKVMPQGFNGLLLPEKYVESDLIDKYHMPRISKIEYPDIVSKKLNPDDEKALEHEQALAKLREAVKRDFEIKNIDKPKITCEVSFVDLSQTEEYKGYKQLQEIYIGDTVHVVHEKLNIKTTQRLIGYRYDPLGDRYIELSLGQPERSFFYAINKASDVVSSIEDIKNDLQRSFIEKAIEKSTALINNGFGGFVKYYPDKVLIMDSNRETTAKNVWQINKNGIGHSSTGVNGPYKFSWTIDGQFNTDFIAAHSITANKLASDVGQSLDLSSNVSINLTVKDYINKNETDLKGRGIKSITLQHSLGTRDKPPQYGWQEVEI